MRPSDVADRFFAAIGRGDLAALAEIYAPDAIIWHNYDDAEQTRDESLRLLGWLHRTVGPLRYTGIRRLETPDGFVQQHVVEFGDIRIPAMLRVYTDGPRILRVEEYTDPTPLIAHWEGR